MKSRLLVMGGIISTMGVALLVAKKLLGAFYRALFIGILLFVVGSSGSSRRNANTNTKVSIAPPPEILG